MKFLFTTTAELNQLALTLIRIGFGILFIGHGALKLIRGKEELLWTGKQMANLGITMFPLFWGICAMLAELGGGVALTLGLCTRIAAFFMAFTMLVAITYHLKNGDSYGYISFPLSQLIVFVGFMIAGAGIYSLDHYFFGK